MLTGYYVRDKLEQITWQILFYKDAKSPVLTNILTHLAQWIDLQISFLSCCFQATCKTYYSWIPLAFEKTFILSAD